ncbi:ATPase [Caldisalinibacter kiritimatiensis]|uniref:ATPase n=1 Tax=Caldisalinibacter kiritimatiensis TaxID=1304284 RepID=R1ATL9_9FIRM|nr:ATPase [Caldisalinibacter kiritimatiensis]EOD00458.1 ATPase [Caldisalinibacter kiritimatiensis]
MSGKFRRVFPGGNTSRGFFSYYDYIIEEDANRIFVIKGGPGTGKSSLMKKVAKVMLEKGYDIEYHHCSSDNDSIDGIVIPKLRVAMIDGTAPHVSVS